MMCSIQRNWNLLEWIQIHTNWKIKKGGIIVLNVSQIFKDYNALNSRIIENKVLINNVEFGSSSIYDISIQTTLVPGEEFTIGTVIPKKLILKIKAGSIIPTNAKIEPFVRLMFINSFGDVPIV